MGLLVQRHVWRPWPTRGGMPRAPSRVRPVIIQTPEPAAPIVMVCAAEAAPPLPGFVVAYRVTARGWAVWSRRELAPDRRAAALTARRFLYDAEAWGWLHARALAERLRAWPLD